MRRRRLLQSLAALPAVGAIPLPAQTAAAPAPAPKNTFDVTLTQPDALAIPRQQYFTPEQRAALERLGGLLVPKVGERPGALEAGAAGFLEFLISQSPADRQELYRNGLDRLNSQAREVGLKGFHDASAQQAETVLVPLKSAWTYAGPSDAFSQFLTAAKDDFLRATINSRAYAEALAANSRGAGGTSYYWYPVE